MQYKTMKKLIALTLAIFWLVACHQTKQELPEGTFVSLEGLWESKDYLKLSEIADSVEYIRLETTTDCILPHEGIVTGELINDILIIQSHMRNANQIYVFDRYGQFRTKVGNYGEGPGEYLDAHVAVDVEHNILFVLDKYQSKLIRYDLKGSFLGETKLPEYSTRLAISEKGQLFLLVLFPRDQHHKSQLLVYNHNGSVINEISLYGVRKPGSGAEKAIMCTFGFIDDELYFNEGPFTCGIHLDFANNWDTSWQIDQGKSALPPESYWDYGIMEFFEGPAVAAVFESSNYLIIGGVHKRSASKLFIHSKKTSQTWPSHVAAETENLQDMAGIFNDFDGGLPFFPQLKAGKDRFLQINDAQRYIDLLNGKLKYHTVNKIVPISEDLRKLCKSLNPEDNPVVMVVQFK